MFLLLKLHSRAQWVWAGQARQALTHAGFPQLDSSFIIHRTDPTVLPPGSPTRHLPTLDSLLGGVDGHILRVRKGWLLSN